MSLLTEQEIRDIARSVKEIGENCDRALILAAQKAVLKKIKAQGPAATITRNGFPHHVSYIYGATELKLYGPSEPLYRLPKGD